MSNRAVQDMMDLLNGDIEDEGPTTKVASEREPSRETASEEMLNRISSQMTEDEILKTAANARMSGKIMAELIFSKLANLLPRLIAETVIAANKHSVPILVKQAIGTSSTIPTGTSMGEQKPDWKPFRDQAHDEDQLGRDITSISEKYLHNDETRGASVSGGGDPDSVNGTVPSGMTGPGKLASAFNVAFYSKLAFDKECVKQASVDAKLKVAAYEKIGGLEEDMMRYQQLQQKQASGQPLSPEEQQEVEMLEAKLAAYMGQGGGQGQGQGAPAPQGGGGGGGMEMPPQKSAAARSNGGSHPGGEFTAEDILREVGLVG